MPSSWTMSISALQAHTFAISSIAMLSISAPVPVPPCSVVEGQPEEVVLGEQLAQVVRILGLLVDLRRPRRHPLLGDLADRVAEIEMLLGNRVGVGEDFHGSAIVSRGYAAPMSVGFSLFLIAAGAILRYAVTWDPNGVNIETVGLILMIVGIVGLVISLAWMATAASRTRDVSSRPPPPPVP